MPEPFDGDELRTIMRRVATPVTVVTYQRDDQARGLTIGSFTSVSLNPPLIAFNLDRTSSHAVLEEADCFAVNVLADDQAHLANHFARSGLSAEEQFGQVDIAAHPAGLPVLEGMAAYLVCEVAACHSAGDSVIMVGRVVAAETEESKHPLLYYNRTYRGVGEERDERLFASVKRLSRDTP